MSIYPPPPLRGCLLVIRRASPFRNLSRACSILKVSTHVSDPKSRTNCTTALKNLPDTLLSAPSRLKSRDSCHQLLRDFTRLPATAGQLSSPDIINHTRYSSADTVYSGFS